MSHWIIRDRGALAHTTGIYFTGWQKEISSSWSPFRNRAMIFDSKKAAFVFLRSQTKWKDYVYTDRGSRLRFVVMKVNAPRRQERPETGSPHSEVGVRRGGGSQDLSRVGHQADAKTRAAA